MTLTNEQILELLKAEEDKHVKQLKPQHDFDKAANFLLDLNFENLFDPWISAYESVDNAMWFRCKGCQRKVKRTGRQSHYDWHRRELGV